MFVKGIYAGAAPKLRLKPLPGVHAYRYEVTETVNGQPTHAYRTDYDIETGRDGVVWAVIRDARESDGTSWQAVKIDPDCRVKMKGSKDAVARVRLWPNQADSTKLMGSDFLDDCAPGGVFFPITDIMNVAIIPLSPTYGGPKLKAAGDTTHFEGFTAHFDRPIGSLTETTHGGDLTLVSVDRDRAVLDWAPALADLDLVEHAEGQTVALKGEEHWAFRVELDPRTGALLRAHTTYDDLDLVVEMAGVPAGQAPHLKITRTVVIEPR